MNTKNDVEVIINGKQYTISGYESSEYLQRIATHINEKYAAFKEEEGYLRLDAEMKNILLAINLTDDYYKAQETVQNLQKEKEDLEKEIFNMKHDMIAMQTKSEKQEKEIEELKKGKTESEHEVIRLETELKNKKEEYSHTEELLTAGEEKKGDESEKEEEEKKEADQVEVEVSGETSEEQAVSDSGSNYNKNHYGNGKRNYHVRQNGKKR